jgi:hypothetical protein
MPPHRYLPPERYSEAFMHRFEYEIGWPLAPDAEKPLAENYVNLRANRNANFGFPQFVFVFNERARTLEKVYIRPCVEEWSN